MSLILLNRVFWQNANPKVKQKLIGKQSFRVRVRSYNYIYDMCPHACNIQELILMSCLNRQALQKLSVWNLFGLFSCTKSMHSDPSNVHSEKYTMTFDIPRHAFLLLAYAT